MLSTIIAVYLLIGGILTGIMMLSDEVRADAATWEPVDLVAFVIFQVLTWPDVVYGIISGEVNK